ncbi:MAG: sulfurtransferase TusA family protein [Thermoleophilia bacterium]|nr:sulfurtransferase TusA family protein [Thermoleophilia bacterium]
MTPVRVVDALGAPCPVPVRLLARAMGRVAPGQVVELLADDPLIEVDLPAWCHARGHRLLELSRDGARWRGLVRRGQPGGGAASEAAAPRS